MTTPTTQPQFSPKLQALTSDPEAIQDPLQNSVQELFSYRMSEEGQQLTAWVRTQYDKMKTQRLAVQRQWYLNLSMYYGKQYVDFIATSGGTFGKLQTPKAPKHRVRSITNKIRPIIRTEMARHTSQKPSASVVPATTEDSDIMAAHAAEQLWESIFSSKQLGSLLVRNAFWTAITGNGFIKTWWDNNKVDRSTLGVDGRPVTGDICYGVVTPFNLFIPDLLEEEIEDQPYVFQAFTKSVDWVKQFWGNKLSNPQPDTISNNELFEASYFSVPGGADDAKPDSCLVIEAYIKPGAHKALPEGGMVTLVGKEMVQFHKGMPYSHEQFPFSHNKSVPTGKFYGDSVLVDLNSLQKEYNRTRSQIIESKNRMARPQLLVAKGSIDVNRLTSEPGLVITYNPGLPTPSPLPMTPIPNYVLQEQDRISQDMEDISGQHQVSRGQAPGGGVEAATAISFLQEKDDSLLATAYQSQETAIEKMARQTLQLIVDYWDIPRTIKVVGSDGSFDALELKGADIKNGIDLRIEAGSSLPTSKPARQALLMDMAKSGFLPPEKMFELLDMGGFNKLVDEIRRDKKEAQRENLRMKKLTEDEVMQHLQQQYQVAEEGEVDPQTGLPLSDPSQPMSFAPIVPVNSWNNHQVHISVHNDFRKSQEFELLPDIIKAEFEKHVATHTTEVQNQAMQNAQMGLPPDMGGGGGGMPTDQGGPQQGMPQMQ